MSWFTGLRSLVYLKRMSDSLERIAHVAEVQSGMKQKYRRPRGGPRTEVYKPTITEWNERHREDHPEMEFQDPDDE